MCSWELEITQVLPPAANRVLFSPISQGWLRARPRKRPQQGNAQHRTFYSSSVMVIREVKSTKSASLFVCRGRASFGLLPCHGSGAIPPRGVSSAFSGRLVDPGLCGANGVFLRSSLSYWGLAPSTRTRRAKTTIFSV